MPSKRVLQIVAIVAAVVSLGAVGGQAVAAKPKPPAKMVGDFAANRGNGSPSLLSSLNGHVYFSMDDLIKGRELWVSDGTKKTTKLVKDIRPGYKSGSPTNIKVLNNQKLIFSADDGVSGNELWSSDGTKGGTQMLKDVTPGPQGTASLAKFTTCINVVFFVANTPTEGAEVWRTDGTEAGTFQVSEISVDNAPSSVGELVCRAGTQLIFAGTMASPSLQSELYSSDGTIGGTGVVIDLNGSDPSNPSGLTAAGNKVYFDACVMATGCELYATDGTGGGTGLVEDLDAASSNPFRFFAVGSRVFFSAGSDSSLYVSDGTPSGTDVVKDVNPFGSDQNFPLGAIGERLFLQCNEGFGAEMCVSDGTGPGTHALADLNADNLTSFGATAVSEIAEGVILFNSQGGSTLGNELYVSDGTEAGTHLLMDIAPDTGDSSLPGPFTVVGSKVFFQANDGPHGSELWVMKVSA